MPAEEFDEHGFAQMRNQLSLESRMIDVYAASVSALRADLTARGVDAREPSDELQWYEQSTLIDDRVLVTTALLDAVEMRHTVTGAIVSEEEVNQIADELEVQINGEVSRRDQQSVVEQMLGRIAEKMTFFTVLRELGGEDLITDEESTAVKRRLQAQCLALNFEPAWLEVIDDALPGEPFGPDDEAIQTAMVAEVTERETSDDGELERRSTAMRDVLERSGLVVDSIGGLLALSHLATRHICLTERSQPGQLDGNWPDEVGAVLNQFQIPRTDHWLAIVNGNFLQP